jgi:hypothetical protein
MTGSYAFPRVQVIPQPSRASLRIDGTERVGYEFGLGFPRPFLFPVIGHSGALLTRLGHPNPVGHEHHRSIWFGHQRLGGVNFWEEKPGTDIKVRHRQVSLYHDGSPWGGLVADLDWWAHGQTLLNHRLILVIEPLGETDFALDLQSRFEVPPGGGPIELGQTNFGFLGVRVAKTLSERFGGGQLVSADGTTSEEKLFGRRFRWVDYSGPSAPAIREGICFMDHPDNPGHPTHWHVRGDGWMSAAFNLASSHSLAAGHPLDLRYRLLIHHGPADPNLLDRAWREFAATPPYAVAPTQQNQLAALQRGTPAA